MARTLRVARHQRRVQRDHVALVEHLLERRIERPEPAHALVGGKQGAHAERLTEARDLLADRALADDPERRPVEVADRVIEEAELAGALPFAGDHVLAIADQGAA